jgi:RND superfamily putative drug exporter
LLGRLAAVVTGRPRAVLLVWLLAVGLLGLQGIDLDGHLSSRTIFIEGSAPERASQITVREFGEETSMVVMLRGPSGAVERQGRELERRLDAIPGTLVSSPWDPETAIAGLRPKPTVAALLLSTTETPDKGAVSVLPPVNEHVDAVVRSPVRASLAGAPVLVDSLQGSTSNAVRVGELLSIPVLMVLLLFVFRSVIAAAIPVVAGGAVVVASRGVLDTLLAFTHIDIFALNAVSMIGLALGVDYSLLIVSRYREELGKGSDTNEAVRVTITACGRAVIPAGAGLALAMLVGMQVLPGNMLTSVALTVIISVLLSVLSALTVVPALLLLLGDRLDRWALPQRAGRDSRAARWSRRLARRTGLAVLALTFLAVAAAGSFGLDTSFGTIDLLPKEDSGRVQQEEVREALGPGWLAPIEIVVNGGNTPITTPDRIRTLAAFQRRVERDPGVVTMTGFDRMQRGLGTAGGIDSELDAQERSMTRLDSGLSRTHEGVDTNSTQLFKAADGARALDSAVESSHGGASTLSEGLGSVGEGSEKLVGGIDRSHESSGRLAEGTTRASSGAGELTTGLTQAEEQIDEAGGGVRVLKNALRLGDQRLSELQAPVQETSDQLAAAERALQQMTTGQADPQYQAALTAVRAALLALTGSDPVDGERPNSSYEGVGSGIERGKDQFNLGLYLADRMRESNNEASEGIGELSKGSAKLDAALHRLAAGSEKMNEAIARLSDGGHELSPALKRLGLGAGHLTNGLAQVGTGASGLADGLGVGAQASQRLSRALARMDSGLDGGSPLSRLRDRSPGLFDSGFFYLASIDGGGSESRNQAGLLLSLDRGGRTARMLVIPRYESSSDLAVDTVERLQDAGRTLASDIDSEVVVGGVTPDLIEIDEVYRDRAPFGRIALALVGLIILVPLMRSLIVPVIAALLNVLTAAATFGLLALLFNGTLLGGPGYVDTTVIPATMMLIFGLAIDYEVFLFARMREEYEKSGSPSLALERGLSQTAHVITGAAIIMLAVFITFATSPFATVRSFGVAQAIGVAIDAFLIRLFVIPVIMRALGRWAWWMPSWLDRLIPGKSRRHADGEAAV